MFDAAVFFLPGKNATSPVYGVVAIATDDTLWGGCGPMNAIMDRFRVCFEIKEWEDSTQGPVRFWGHDLTQFPDDRGVLSQVV